VRRRPTGGSHGSPVRILPILAVALLVAASLHGVTAPAHPPEETRLSATVSGSQPILTIDPSNWWISTGNSTSLSATWTGGAPGCTVASAWFTWGISNGTPVGELQSTEGALVNFSATSNETGTDVVSVLSAGEVDCGSQREPISGSAVANVTVLAPLSLQDLSVGPGPALPNVSVNLTGALVGGLAPYRIEVDWGDGTRSSTNLSAAGPFAIPHDFPAGRYSPSVSVEDALGSLAPGSVVEPIVVSDRLAVGIESASDEVELNVPAHFALRTADWAGGSAPFALCDGRAPTSASLAPGGENFTCTFTEVGPATVFAGVGSPNSPASTNILIDTAEPPLSMAVDPPLRPSEVGRPSDVEVIVVGGVPPFRLETQILGGPNATVLPLPEDGAVLTTVNPSVAGSLPTVVTVTDALGVEVASATEVTAVPPLAVDTSYERSLLADGSPVSIGSTVTSGDPPFYWSVNATTILASSDPFAGVTGSGAPFEWSGLMDPEEPGPLTERVIDSAGAIVSEAVPPLLASPLAGHLSVTAGPPGWIEVAATLTGGVPPFALWVNASDGESWTFSAPADGSYTWSATTDHSLRANVTAVALDRFGDAITGNSTVSFTAPPGSGGPSGFLDVAGLVGGVGLLGVTGFLWSRHRRTKTAPPPPPDPERVLYRILEPADGADRATVELLAEEAGIPLPTVRATIDRLVEAGTIRSETSADGEEVLAWSHTSPQ
jgi:hypothetical protein